MSFNLQNNFADRIGGHTYGTDTTIYKFEAIKRAKILALQKRPEVSILDFGVGEPDSMAFNDVVQTLCIAAAKPENKNYADNGCLEFNQAASIYMKKLFGVTLNAQDEIMHCIGVKSALSILPACFINPGDITLMTSPGYPIAGLHTRYYQGQVHHLPLLAKNDYLPDLQSIPEAIIKKAKLLVLNYPNNPTGALATYDFYKEAIAFANKHNIIIIQDAAYASLVFDTKKYLSILSIPGGMDVAIELHSLSKSFNMTGWRIGWVCGHSKIVNAYGHIKDNTDSGQFLAIQKAAIHALNHPEYTHQLCKKYSRRMDLLLNTLKKLGFIATKPSGTFFIYTPAPRQAKGPSGNIEYFDSARSFSEWLIHEHSISTVPWDEAGPHIRFSVTFCALTLDEEIKTMDILHDRLKYYQFSF